MKFFITFVFFSVCALYVNPSYSSGITQKEPIENQYQRLLKPDAYFLKAQPYHISLDAFVKAQSKFLYNHKTCDGLTPLHDALNAHNYLAFICFYKELSKDATYDINAQTHKGNTIFHFLAASHKDKDILLYIFADSQNRINPYLQNNEKKTPEQIAQEHHNIEFLTQFLKWKRCIEVLEQAKIARDTFKKCAEKIEAWMYEHYPKKVDPLPKDSYDDWEEVEEQPMPPTSRGLIDLVFDGLTPLIKKTY